MTIGDGVNGHPGIMHGGIVATILDEGMGILQGCNFDRDHVRMVGQGRAEGELPPEGITWFTAEMKVRYLRPVMTSGPLLVTARINKREGRKEWIYAEVKQRVGASEDYYGDEVVCATGEALFIAPKGGSKL
jgi:acyl-coenzyme A thioesterase PaaI-like protein